MNRQLSRGLIQGMVILLITTGNIFGQSPSMEEADAFFSHQDYSEAVTAYQLITKNDSSNVVAWFRLGQSLYQLQRYQKALSAYLNADRAGSLQGSVRYNLACTNAMLGNEMEAIAWLNKALDVGFAGMKQLESDPDLSTVRSNARFTGLLRRCDKNARPCEYDERYRQFDFWLGEWEVYNTAGKRVGTNHIEKQLEGCVLKENWVSLNGIGGQSTNYFDPASGKWIQIWVSQSGDHTYFEGDFIDGGMHFIGENVSLDGTSQLNRMTIEPDGVSGNVHQLIETSDDDGINWTISFDGIYRHPGAIRQP